jgi:glycosyltransferase involved in cell wall biosynthesis
MVTPLVSIVIPIYNTEKFLTECLDSIYTQTYKYLEIILINDGSTDKSPAIIDKHAKTDKRVKVIHKQNEGVSATKNLGLRKASGKFIAFIDSDDYIRNDFIENLMNAMIKFDSLIASTPTVSQHNLTNKMDTKIIEAFDHYESFERLFYGTLENSDNGIQMFDRQLLVDNFVQFDQAKKNRRGFRFLCTGLGAHQQGSS